MSKTYVGGELELFSAAIRWKSYVAHHLAPFIGGAVLEVGAGIGRNIPLLWTLRVTRWTALEPDPAQADRIRVQASADPLRVVTGTLAALEPSVLFDTILYLDVLEHIRDDRAELTRASALLAPGGHLIVLAPAHQFLFSPFDKAIGHFRRYSLTTLAALAPPNCRISRQMMLDSIGLFASLASRLILASAMPTSRQIAFWDKVLVPLSRLVDPLTGYRFGKTAIMVWRHS